jgi:phosphoserine phosphatase RsbU/P
VTESARISRVIFEYATKIGGARETEAALQMNAAMARDLVGADRCSIWLIDSKMNQLWTKVAHGVDELRIPLGQGMVGACIAENTTIVVNDTSRDQRFHSLFDRKSGYLTRSVVSIPLRGAEGKVIGALQVLNKPGGFNERDVDLLGLAAAYSAAALETQVLRLEAEAARLLRRELEIARSVQERLFPQDPPILPGLDYAARCRPAKTVGGDYFDFIAMPDGGMLFTLGDVSGKGIAAAVLMASIQASIRSQALRRPESVATLVTDFNQAVYSFSSNVKYSTLFCGLLDQENRKLTYVNAGQVPPVVIRAAGRIERLREGGMPLGLMSTSRYQEADVVLEPGDVVVCFSDGISEATNVRDEMWDEACLSLLQQSAHLSAGKIIDQLVAGVDEFAGEAEQADDITVVVLKAVDRED